MQNAQFSKVPTMEPQRPGGKMQAANPAEPRKSQIDIATGAFQRATQMAYFIPAMVAMAFVAAIFFLIGRSDLVIVTEVSQNLNGVRFNPPAKVDVPYYMLAIGLAFALAGLGVLYKVVGRVTKWWIPVAIMFVTALLLETWVFKGLNGLIVGKLGFWLPSRPAPDEFIANFVTMFWRAGVVEELYKQIPVLVLLALGASSFAPWNTRYGIREPIDAILVGVAAGVGFALNETAVVYFARALVPDPSIKSVGALVYTGVEAGALMVPRFVGTIFGHAAYAGILAFYLAMAFKFPKQALKLVAIGIGTAAGLHGLWNSAGNLAKSFGVPGISPFLYFLVGAAAFMLLVSAIHKARRMTEDRGRLMRSELVDGLYNDTTAPAAKALPQAGLPQAMAPASNAAPLTAVGSSVEPGLLMLHLGDSRIPVAIGARIYASQAPGLQSENGIVGEVSANPNDARVLGLKNCSLQPWVVIQPNGDERELQPGKSIRLSAGMQLRLGSLLAQVR